MHLFLLADLVIGGSETKVVRIANALTSQGRQQIAIGWLSEPSTLAAEIDARIPRLFLQRRMRADIPAALRLSRWIREHRPQSIVCVNLYPTLYALAARSLARIRVPCVALVNTTEFANRKEALQMRAVYRHTLARMYRVVYGCDCQRQLWLTRYGLDPGKSLTIYNGVRLERFNRAASPRSRESVRSELGLSPNEFVVGTVGAMRTEKAQADLLDAVAALTGQMTPVRTMLVGDGPLRSSLEERARTNHIADRVIFLGAQADVRPFLLAMDVFVLPSLSETFSNAALEAMAMGIPVVLTDTGGAPEMVVRGETGALFAPGNVSELASRLRELIVSPETRQRFSERALRRVVERFTFEGMLDQYDRLLASSAGHPATNGPVAQHL